MNEEILVDYEGQQLSILFDETVISNVNVTDNPNVYTTTQRKNFEYYDYYGLQKGVQITNTLHVDHHLSTYVFTENKNIRLEGKVNVSPGMHIRKFYMKLNGEITKCGSSIPEIGYCLDLMTPGGFIHNKVFYGVVQGNDKVRVFQQGKNTNGQYTYTVAFSNRKSKPSDGAIFKCILKTTFLWIFYKYYYLINNLVFDLFDKSEESSFFTFCNKIDSFSNLIPKKIYCFLFVFFSLMNVIKVNKLKKMDKVIEEKEKADKKDIKNKIRKNLKEKNNFKIFVLLRYSMQMN